MKTDGSFLVLQYQATRVTLDPNRGGAIRELNWRGHDLLRPTPAGAGDDPFDMACFPMIPYANRIKQGRFDFGGRSVHLARNWSQDPHPLHGQGWRAPWSVVDESSSSATLRFEGGGDEWPWKYQCEQSFQLMQDGLGIELALENLSDAVMPVMLGLHPYFPAAGRAQLQAHLPRVWMTDEAALPMEEALTPVDWRFDHARAVGSVPLDHAFSGWNGIASLRWPDRTLTIRATHCNHLHIYVPTNRDFFCVEPQTAAPGALSRKPTEATALEPGDRCAIRVHFSAGAS
jgi:aldose 1-epimerase